MTDEMRLTYPDERQIITPAQFECSSELNELSEALSKAQGDMKGALKDSSNPFFKSKYADLSAVWDDLREPLAANGISVVQMPINGLDHVSVVTQLTHKSGQWMRSTLSMIPEKKTPQGVGSCITYIRRYALAAMGGVYQIDDDGNEASQPGRQQMDDSVYVDEKKIQEIAKDARDIVDLDDEENGPGNARALYEPLNNDERMRLQAVMKASSPEGVRKTYWSIFHDHLKRAVK